MYLVRFGRQSHDPVWTVGLLHSRPRSRRPSGRRSARTGATSSTRSGIKWGLVQHKLADYLPETFSPDHQERFEWVHQHRLVKRALNEILGDDGWRSGTRDGSQRIVATTAAGPGPAGQPASS